MGKAIKIWIMNILPNRVCNNLTANDYLLLSVSVRSLGQFFFWMILLIKIRIMCVLHFDNVSCWSFTTSTKLLFKPKQHQIDCPGKVLTNLLRCCLFYRQKPRERERDQRPHLPAFSVWWTPLSLPKSHSFPRCQCVLNGTKNFGILEWNTKQTPRINDPFLISTQHSSL